MREQSAVHVQTLLDVLLAILGVNLSFPAILQSFSTNPIWTLGLVGVVTVCAPCGARRAHATSGSANAVEPTIRAFLDDLLIPRFEEIGTFASRWIRDRPA